MLQIKKALQLLDAGKSERSISEQLGISRNTLRKYLEKITLSKLSISQVLALPDADFSILVYGEPTAIVRTTQGNCF